MATTPHKRLTLQINKLKSNSSASLIPNNLTTSSSRAAYVHKNSIILAKDITKGGKIDSYSFHKCAGVDTQISNIQFCRLETDEVLVVVTLAGFLHVLDRDGKALLHELPTHESHLSGIASHNNTIFIGTRNGSIVTYNTKYKIVKVLKAHSTKVCDLTIHKDWMVSGDANGAVIIWSLPNQTKLKEIAGKGAPILSLCSGHNYVCAGFSTGHIRMYDLEKLTLHVEIAAHTRAINAVTMHPTLKYCAVCSEDTFVSIWNLPEPGKNLGTYCVAQISPTPSLLVGLSWTDDLTLLCTAYDSRYISIIQIQQ